jgi:hypothetical protein
MHNAYPGQESDDEPRLTGVSRVNQIVYGGIHRALDNGRPGMTDPDSPTGRAVLSRLTAMSEHVEGQRLAVLSGLAQIDSGRRAEAAEVRDHAELAAIMEEAPGA